MKKVLISLFIALTSMTVCAQTNMSENTIVSPDSNVVYRLFPTNNMWTFIKLNTRNGQMWQVQYSVKDNQFQVPLNLTTLVTSEEEQNGRFFLHPTQNSYNFILIDQFDGRVWQVQWSQELNERMIIRIY